MKPEFDLAVWILVCGALAGCTQSAKSLLCGACSNTPLSALASSSAAMTPTNQEPVATKAFHSQDLANPIFHGTVVAAAGWDYTKALVGGLSCSACHAGDSPTEPSPNAQAPNCFTCHDGGPDGSAFHAPGWLDEIYEVNDPSVLNPFFHGAVVRAANWDYTRAMVGKLSCATCHAGESPTEPSPNSRAPSCSTCHAGGPDGSPAHPSTWLDPSSPNFHGKVVATFFAAVGVAGQPGTAENLTCIACHAGISPSQPSPNSRAPNCFTCHAGGPDGSAGHPPGWTDYTSPDFHGTVVENAGFDYTKAMAGALTCNTCHAGNSPDQISPNTNAPNCYSCHPGGPDGSPGHPSGWLDPTSVEFHGLVVEDAGFDYTRARVGKLTCSSCHTDVPGQTSPNPNAPNCLECHPHGIPKEL